MRHSVGHAALHGPAVDVPKLEAGAGLAAEEISAILAEAGLKPVSDKGDVVYCGRGFLTVIASSEGERTLRFSREVSLRQVAPANSWSAKGSDIRITMQKYETRIFELA